MKSLQNISYKTLFTILFFSIAGIVFFLKIGSNTQKVSAAWWDEMWHYRQAINISSHTTAESNVYIIATVNIGTTTKAQVDDGDFRFISQSGENLNYYITSGVGTTTISFHILIPSFPAGAQTIYTYYGNPSATNGFSVSDFSTQASNYTIGSLSTEEIGGGPIAYWKFDEGSGTTAYDSMGNNNGILSGTTSPEWQNEDQCVSGKCLYFNGINSYINNPSPISNLSGMSIQFWIKIPNINSGSRYLLDGRNGGNWWFLQDYVSGACTDTNGNICFNGLVEIPSSYLSNNKWHYISLTTNSTSSKIYLDGILINSGSGFTPSIGTNLRIGTRYTTSSFLSGYLDELKIYPYARTADQIKQDYNSRGSISGSSVNLGVQSNTTPNLKSSLVAHWKFDENNGTTAYDSVSSNNATFNTGTSIPTWNNGKFNKALSFNGINNYLSTSYIPNIPSNQITISAWVNPSKVSENQEISNQGQWDGGPWTGWRLHLLNGGAIYFKLGNGTSTPYFCEAGNINTNSWQQVTGVWDGNFIRIYINGIEKGKCAQSFSYLGNTSTHWIGKYPGSAYFFNGLIDDVKIYNRALTPEEIKQDYNQGSVVQFGATSQNIGGTTTSLEYCIPGDTTYCAPPIAEWKMDEGVGTSVVDTSGNNNTGIFSIGNSAPTWSQGKIGSALNFDGTNDYLSIGIPSVPINYTISAWINLKAMGREQHFAEFNGNQLYISSSNRLGTSSWSNASGTTILTTDKWYHAVLTRNSSEVRLYLNGVFEGVGTSGSDPSSPFVIGDLYAHSGNYKFSGKIDHIKIYNYTRTPAQIAYDYNRGGPVGHWKLDECQGNTAYDWSGNTNHGTINIGTLGTQNSLGTCTIGTSAAWTNGSTGKINSSLNFDGADDYIQIPNVIPGDDTHSILFWVKPTSYNSVWVDMSGDSGYSFIQIDPTNLHIGYSPTTPLYRSYPYTFNTNNWYHIAILKNNTGDNIDVYINGVFLSSYSGSVGNMNSGSIMYLGQFHGGWNSSGQIDDVRIYNYTLTSEQVKQVYNGGAVNFR